MSRRLHRPDVLLSSSMMRAAGSALALALVLSACSSADSDGDAEPSSQRSSSSPDDQASATPSTDSDTPGGPAEEADPVSIPGVAAQTHTGTPLQIGAVRERSAAFTSYDVSWQVSSSGPGAYEEPLRLSGVLNVPVGDGPFPAVVLAHGYIDPGIYESGQGMTRERGFLAERGYVALHVDYRGHAESDADPSGGADVRLGYAVDVISAVDALRKIALRDGTDVPVDPDRVALFGRSMGGGVVQKVAAISPGLVDAVVAWASVSSLEAENFDQFIRDDNDERLDTLVKAHGLPEDSPDFWEGVSPRPWFDRITEPFLAVHGRADDTCPPQWARATQRAMRKAGVESELAWYDDGHAFGPAFIAAMERTFQFLDEHLD